MDSNIRHGINASINDFQQRWFEPVIHSVAMILM